ncbi:ribonuclease H-like protein [Delitschia confertaspora ATCC 74209]|uniref:Ribonuclease H-like protein n=1 Tax=Delitschia confertaspora ATCC 74209 TaxID=1513339 RepID=A0A9P4JUQ8_9PLEO|nr:ribonuclease H-like protein [Delitschia confertaspora ATCC 74209]
MPPCDPWEFSYIRVTQFKSILSLIGSSTTGNKAQLTARVSSELRKPQAHRALFKHGKAGEEKRNADGPPGREKLRILSIDMGIRNLAFCVADVTTKPTPRPEAEMEVLAWKRLNVADEVAKLMAQKTMSKAKKSKELEGSFDSFSPAALSHAAYTLLTETLLPWKPDVILIERQRWRSGGGAAIQEWTLRVNTLESMFWAILTSLREAQKSVPKRVEEGKRAKEPFQVFDINPKRVGQFWINEEKPYRSEDEVKVEEESTTQTKDPPRAKPLTRAKAEKLIKIQLVHSWLTATSPATSGERKRESVRLNPWLDLSNTLISFRFSGDAEGTRRALCAPLVKTKRGTTRAKKGKKKTQATDEAATGLKKLDDVTDCFLQAAAWVAWEGNRKRLLGWWEGTEVCDLSEEDWRLRVR